MYPKNITKLIEGELRFARDKLYPNNKTNLIEYHKLYQSAGHSSPATEARLCIAGIEAENNTIHGCNFYDKYVRNAIDLQAHQ